MTVPSAANGFAAAFARTLRLSPSCARIAAARPELARELEARQAAGVSRTEMQARLAGSTDPAVALRRLRAEVMLTLAHRDLNGLAPLSEVLDTMTALAEVAIGHAAVAAQAAAEAVHGAPEGGQVLIVAGLGKLGGGELNVSSDVDLVFAYGEDGETAGPRRVSHQEFFASVGKRLIALLAEITGDGQVFRVDMRLRPFGDAGPLVSSLAALEHYFVGHARPWERYAWLKARVLHGPAEGLDALVRPFVYRRYLDYGLLAALRELHGRIFEAANARGKSDDVKVGTGGIREAEFAVQLLQLVRGGRDPGLQLTSTREALAALAGRDLIEAPRAQALGAAYAFLRKLEHRLQYYDDQQTQALPTQAAHQQAIAEAMDFADYPALLAALAVHRAGVQEAFNALFERPAAGTPVASLVARLTDPQAPPDPAALADDLARAGIADPAPLAERLAELTRSRRYAGLSASSRARLEALLPRVVEAAAREGGTAATGLRLLDLLEAIDRREAYLSLLVEYPQVLERAARIMARSAWAARLLARHPILLDELTRTTANFTATDWAAEREALVAECAVIGEDTERLLDALRQFKQRHVLRLAIADLEGELAVMALSDELSALADLLLDVVLARAARSFGRDGTSGLAIVGYGKLGGKELGYGSDLDMVFLYDEALAGDAAQLARIWQRVNSWITSHTSAGVLYETDLRLRPDGAAGQLVSSLGAFREYQLKRAWTWEHQALTRARFCAGDGALGARFEQVRDEILAAPRDAGKLRTDIVAMRQKMRDENRRAVDDLKHVSGGMVDLEFATQALVLAHGPAHPKLRANKGNHQLLRWAGALGLVEAGTADAAAEAYLEIRRRTHDAALNDEEKARAAEGDLESERAAVRRLWAAVFT